MKSNRIFKKSNVTDTQVRGVKPNRIFKKSNVTDTQVKGEVKQDIQEE